ncbi:Crp/Fnr family transcriptional regulator [Pontibacter cellulosilyticus]|uniref:Crp/Fnr family transcriptional regulator n=1 Tax=Pontibacter cellulosilyticus TaxID=1720253 RepID=A0A923SPX2_9BACT|nr:Crp/Fnr family transcriptional regulator [Pontibacter cellulosilyticus]MBC5994570.1 Crp/Fnr family transcriptional regulator [Pontibacter cellulosilyticus]
MQEHLLTEYRAAITRYMQTHEHLLEKYGINCVQYEPQHQLLKQDAQPHSLFILQTGLVKVVRTTSLGQAYSLGIFDRGEVLGDVEAIMEMPHFGTVETVTNCTLWKMAPQQFLKMLSQEPEFNLLIHRNVISKLLNTSHKAAIQSTNKLFYSLMVVLREFSKLNELQISKALLAEALGTSTRNLNRLLAQLEEEQIINTQQTIIKEINLQLLQHKIHAYENTIQ